MDNWTVFFRILDVLVFWIRILICYFKNSLIKFYSGSGWIVDLKKKKLTDTGFFFGFLMDLDNLKSVFRWMFGYFLDQCSEININQLLEQR